MSKKEGTVKEARVSISHALSSFKSSTAKLVVKGYISEEDARVLKEIKDKAVNKYVKDKF